VQPSRQKTASRVPRPSFDAESFWSIWINCDLLWSTAEQGDVAQFDFAASAATGKQIQRIIVECKGGDNWGHTSAF
jgi:hypothetical protein